MGADMVIKAHQAGASIFLPPERLASLSDTMFGPDRDREWKMLVDQAAVWSPEIASSRPATTAALTTAARCGAARQPSHSLAPAHAGIGYLVNGILRRAMSKSVDRCGIGDVS
jgi:hypothetical protein